MDHSSKNKKHSEKTKKVLEPTYDDYDQEDAQVYKRRYQEREPEEDKKEPVRRGGRPPKGGRDRSEDAWDYNIRDDEDIKRSKNPKKATRAKKEAEDVEERKERLDNDPHLASDEQPKKQRTSRGGHGNRMGGDRPQRPERTYDEPEEPEEQPERRQRTARGGHGRRDGVNGGGAHDYGRAGGRGSPPDTEAGKRGKGGRAPEEQSRASTAEKGLVGNIDDLIDPDREIEQCLICCEDITLYAIQDCGHNICCWNCTLKQRLKMGNETCVYCKEPSATVMISTDKDDSIQSNKDAVCDTDFDIHYQNVRVKNFVNQHLGFYCPVCKKNGSLRKFPSHTALGEHLDHAHHSHFCDLCFQERPVLVFEQILYSRSSLKKHKEVHPACGHCSTKYKPKLFYDHDSLYKHYRNNHYYCDVCKKLGKKKKNAKTGQVEYTVYRDIDDLRAHYKKDHYVCKKGHVECLDLAFPDSAQLAQHYLRVHNEQLAVQLDFRYSDDEDEKPDDHEQRKKYKQQLKQQQEQEKYDYGDYYDEEEDHQNGHYGSDLQGFGTTGSASAKVGNSYNLGSQAQSKVQNGPSKLPKDFHGAMTSYADQVAINQAIMEDRQEWTQDKDKYKEEFPTLGGKSRRQRKQDMLKAKAMTDFPLFEHGATKKPVKYSDSMKQIMKNERMREMEKYGMKVIPQKKAPAMSSASDFKFDEYAGNMLKVGAIEEKKAGKKKKKAVVEEEKWYESELVQQSQPAQPPPPKKKEKKEEKKEEPVLPPNDSAFAEARGGGGKKSKKPKASVVCAPTEFYEVSDKIEIDFHEEEQEDQTVSKKDKKKDKKKKKEKEKTDFQKMFYEERKDDDLTDFKFPDGAKIEEEPKPADTFVDDSTMIMRGPGKKKRGGAGHRQQWVELNPHELKKVDYTKLYRN